MADGIGDGPKDADRRGVHDKVGELEHGFREASGERQHGTPFCFGNQDERHGKEDAEDDNLQHLALGDGFGDVFGKDVGDELCRGVWSGAERFGGSRRRKTHAFTRAAETYGRPTDDERNRGNNFKVNKRFDTEAADFLQVGVARDAYDQGAEQQRCDDDLDEAQKNRAKEL